MSSNNQFLSKIKYIWKSNSSPCTVHQFSLSFFLSLKHSILSILKIYCLDTPVCAGDELPLLSIKLKFTENIVILVV